MKPSFTKVFLSLVLSMIAFYCKAQTTFYENFDGYISGQNLYEQASVAGDTNWRLWSGSSSEDAVISDNYSISPEHSLLIQSDDDIVFYPGSYTSGRWFFSGHIYIVSGHTAYFNMMHNWYDQNFEWACQVFFPTSGTGRLNVGGSDYTFPFNHEEWLYFSMEIDLDHDSAAFWVNDQLIYEWPWHYIPGGTGGADKFEAVDFYGWNDNSDSALYYLDEVQISTDAIIRFEDKNVTWDGNPKPVTVKTYPPNLAYDLTYDGETTVPTEPGTYAIVATITEPGYSGSATGSFIINKANALVAITNTNAIYDGTTKEVFTSTDPTGLAVSILYNGNPALPVNAGTYAVKASIDDAHYEGLAYDTLIIDKAIAQIVFSDTVKDYTGSATGVTISTSPASLAADILYDGSSTVPVQVGSYHVEASISEVNYVGTNTTTLQIKKAAASINLSGTTAVYDGMVKQVVATTTPLGLSVDITYNGSTSAPENAGMYIVIATIADGNYEGSAIDTLKIEKALAQISTTDISSVYDGTTKEITVHTIPEGLSSTITYNGGASLPVNAGKYFTSIEINDANYQGAVFDTLTILKAQADIFITSGSFVFDSLQKTITVETLPVGLSTTTYYNGEVIPPVNAGNYVIETVIDDANYYGSAFDTLTIAQANAEVTLSVQDGIYDGNGKQATVQVTPSNAEVKVTYNRSTDIPVDAGVYIVEALITDNNYTGIATDTFEIEKAEAIVLITDLACGYTGRPQSVTVTTQPENIDLEIFYNESNTKPTDVGTYNVVVNVIDSNYTGNAHTTLTINKANQTISWNQDLDGLSVGSEVELTATASSGLNVGYISDNDEIAYISGSTLTIIGTGEFTITAVQEGNTNYNEVSLSQTVEIQASAIRPVTSSPLIFKFWPNPVIDILNVRLETNDVAKIEIFNQSGAKVLEENLLSSDSWIDLSELSTGVYILKVTVHTNTTTVKISKR